MNEQPRRATVIEDDPDLRELLSVVLRQAGFEVETFASGQAGLDGARRSDPDLVTLDLGLPDLDGVEVCRQLRATGSEAYVIMLTARAEEIDLLLGLEIGADDYLTKPFSTRELRARATAMLRRPRRAARAGVEPPDSPTVLRVADIVLDNETHTVTLAGAELNLTRTEFDLLHALMSNPRRVWSRQVLLSRVWGTDWASDTHLVEVHIGNLRRKLGEAQPRADPWIRTIRGVGYRIGSDDVR